jgi:hypothetical protein
LESEVHAVEPQDREPTERKTARPQRSRRGRRQPDPAVVKAVAEAITAGATLLVLLLGWLLHGFF